MRTLLSALGLLLLSAIAPRAEAAVLTVDVSAPGTPLTGFDLEADLTQSVSTGAGTYVFTGLEGAVVLDGTSYAVSDATLTASGGAFSLALPGEFGGTNGLVVTLLGTATLPEDAASAFLAIRSAGFAVVAYTQAGVPTTGFGPASVAAQIPLPPAAALFALPFGLAAWRRIA